MGSSAHITRVPSRDRWRRTKYLQSCGFEAVYEPSLHPPHGGTPSEWRFTPSTGAGPNKYGAAHSRPYTNLMAIYFTHRMVNPLTKLDGATNKRELGPAERVSDSESPRRPSQNPTHILGAGKVGFKISTDVSGLVEVGRKGGFRR